MPSHVIGAAPTSVGTRFVVWGLGHEAVQVDVEGHGLFVLEPWGNGYFGAEITGIRAGDLYQFRVDGGSPMPESASQCQPQGNDGPSMVVDPEFRWTDGGWMGPDRRDQILYELHIGTFTAQGTWRAAAERLEHLHQLGVSILQVMPVGTFKGRFGWGYDTTMPYAPYAPYGTPTDMRAFIDRAHALGIRCHSGRRLQLRRYGRSLSRLQRALFHRPIRE